MIFVSPRPVLDQKDLFSNLSLEFCYKCYMRHKHLDNDKGIVSQHLRVQGAPINKFDQKLPYFQGKA